MKANTIIAVKNIEESSKWYQTVFGLESKLGGEVFNVLVTKKNEALICLHKWGEHQHPSLKNPDLLLEMSISYTFEQKTWKKYERMLET